MDDSSPARLLDRTRVRQLLIMGIIGSVLTGIGDFLLGYAEPANVGGGMFDTMVATAPNCSNEQLIAGGLLGMVGLVLEGVAFFAIYRLIACGMPRASRIYRAGAIGYIWLAPIGCHLNVATFNIAYKYLWLADPAAAHEAIIPLYAGIGLPVYLLLVIAWIPMLIMQIVAFARGRTPYPRYAAWFHLFVGMAITLVVSTVIGNETALGGGIGTMFLSVGNLITFGGLLAALPNEQRFNEFRAQYV